MERYASGRRLSQIKGKGKLQKLLGLKVVDGEGRFVGYVSRIWIVKRTGKAKCIEVKSPTNIAITLPPDKLLFLGDHLRYVESLEFTNVLRHSLEMECEKYIREIRELLKKVKSCRDELLMLDEQYLRGELSKGEYIKLRNKLEAERLRTIDKAKLILLEVESRIKEISTYSTKNGYFKKLRVILAEYREIVENLKVQVDIVVPFNEFINILSGDGKTEDIIRLSGER